MNATTRRQFLSTAGIGLATAAVGGIAIAAIVSDDTGPRAGAAPRNSTETFPLTLTDAQWRDRLTSEQYVVLRQEGTERPYSSPLDNEHRVGTFACAGCGQKLFDAATKFDSGTGWPSFYQPLANAVGERIDNSYGVRTEVHCANCGGHLGHVFDDGPAPTGLRYCMNGVAMKFEAA